MPAARSSRVGGASVAGPDRFLDLADRQIVVHGAAGELLLERAVRRPEERAGVAHTQRCRP